MTGDTMPTDEKPYLVQRIINIEHGTSIDTGVVHALDAEHARERAVANDLIGPFEAFRVLSLDSYSEPIPAHFRSSAGVPETHNTITRTEADETPDERAYNALSTSGREREHNRLLRAEEEDYQRKARKKVPHEQALINEATAHA